MSERLEGSVSFYDLLDAAGVTSSFKQKLNEWGTVEWIVEEPSRNINFLDLTLQLQNSKITMKTFQKSINLYLHIPAGSAHPPKLS